jgi:Bacterial PH domain
MSEPDDDAAPGVSLADLRGLTMVTGSREPDDRYTGIDLDPADVPPLVARFLLPLERDVIAVRRHWIVLIPAAAVAIGGLAAAIALNSWAYESGTASLLLVRVIWFGWLAGLGWAILKWAGWHFTWFVATSQRLMYITGLFRRRVTPLPLSRLTDCRMEQDVPGRRLGFGTLICESFATDHALHEVTFLPEIQWLFNQTWELRLPLPTMPGPKLPGRAGE